VIDEWIWSILLTWENWHILWKPRSKATLFTTNPTDRLLMGEKPKYRKVSLNAGDSFLKSVTQFKYGIPI
jgi:hypothetical protein